MCAILVRKAKVLTVIMLMFVSFCVDFIIFLCFSLHIVDLIRELWNIFPLPSIVPPVDLLQPWFN